MYTILLAKTSNYVVDNLREPCITLKFSAIIIVLAGILILPATGESTKITVDAGGQEILPINGLELGYQVSGSLAVSGGGNEIVFSVLDPDGNTILHLGTVIQGKSFEFTAQKNGAYSFRMDNRDSTAPKNVMITYEVRVSGDSSNPYLWTGIFLILTLTIFLFLIYWRRRGHDKAGEASRTR
jgi:emp24/gp25L/p24 family/GOLD